MMETAPIRLSELTHKIRAVFTESFRQQTYWVVADITNYTFQENKRYHYFDLVEKDTASNQIVARVQAAAWGTGSARITEFEKVTGQPFQNDLQVLVQVSVEYHAVYGLKLILQHIDPGYSLGLIEKAKQETLKRLLAECGDFIRLADGEYLTRNKQLKFSRVIQRIALVTSGSSAAIQDFKHTLLSNRFNYRFAIDDYFTLVQGETNAQAFYHKLLEVFNSGKHYDAVVIIRGGGAQTDFLLFDQFIMGKIVAKFPIPIITGIGHHKDETIVDLMAHSATKTPTRAAEFIISHNRAFEDRLIVEKRAILIYAQQSLAARVQGLHRLNLAVLNKSRAMLYMHTHLLTHFSQITINQSKALLNKQAAELFLHYKTLAFYPRSLVIKNTRELKNQADNIQSFSRLFLLKQKDHLQYQESFSRLMSPVNILKKGFAIIYYQNRITGNPEEIPEGAEIIVRMAETRLISTVNTKIKTDGDGGNY